MVKIRQGFHEPDAFRTGQKWKGKMKKAISYIEDDGMKVPEALVLAFGVSKSTWYRWKDEALKDWENGFTGTNLQNFVTEICKADMNSGRKLTRRARQIALDEEEPSIDMLKFLLERRHGYRKKSKEEVEVKATDDFNFNINIVDSKKE